MTHTTTTEGELHQAIQAGLNRRTTEPRATSVRYDPERDAIEIELTGYGIELDRFDIAMHDLQASLVTIAEMASTLGKRGGAVRLDAKHETTRTNGAKGGRPRKVSRGA